MPSDAAAPSQQAIRVLRLLKLRHNVLITGPPATGKTRLMNEVREAFAGFEPVAYDPDGDVPFPDDGELPAAVADWMPSPDRDKRQVFSTVFHPHSKHRDFVRGISPRLDGQPGFTLVDGELVRAAAHAVDGASLLIIDELNRGPAVQLFGESISAIEHDKRLAPDGTSVPGKTVTFPLLQPGGETAPYSLSHHLYLLASMNQADTSVEPLDTAFLRRWEEFQVLPDAGVLADYFGVDLGDQQELPAAPADPAPLYVAAARAWQAINDRIELGRGRDFQIGHGVLMEGEQAPASLQAGVEILLRGLRRLRTHVEEVFFGDLRATAHVFNIQAGPHPWTFEEVDFAGDIVTRLRTGDVHSPEKLMELLDAISGE